MRTIALFLVLVMLSQAAFGGIGTNEAMYVGGTITSVPEKTEGTLSLGEKAVAFDSKKGKIEIPFDKIQTIEYGQKAGRRVGATIGLAVAVGIFAAPMLLSKKRKHYVTLGFADEKGKEQAVVIELGKNIIRTTLAGLEAKTGKKIEYQDEEARKSAGV